ncbi:with coiled-coil, ANK repeat and PH domain-containing protein [Seminavis robusta]|uniref:With coiled-coil, ANK repeat and PH domain-containing protein n=1 Tax=Seminavis robusta TaxID=568900 RepID=A0A9N8DGQ4_9STRA|nr:with coiled-coil, ANK repeat and PH domain-containing protein [Seminavis robusta]|eukprot:Sro117_g057490.1 with coiled-coil, ANK repeat and PH domain-containing protein (558) ;mRNA; f:94042-95843
MADQKEMKKRLKVLMQKPENQVCSDCPERQPRWASLIVAPPGSPPGTLATGAFCCLECSGSHRRLGVHISFVRSINLDSWKEKEVLAMENGGNKKVNAIWEANLARFGAQKPPSGADLTTRERYIRDKYERRKFFDPTALVNYQNNEPSFDDLVPKGGADFANFGPPPDTQVSDAAKLRAEKKKKKAPTRNKSFEAPSRSKSGEGKKRNKKEPEPAVADLLDFGAVEPAVAPPTNSSSNGGAPFGDFFGQTEAQAGPPAQMADTRQGGQDRAGGGRRRGSRSRSKSRADMRTKSKTPDREKTRKTQQQDILNMYNAPMGAPAVPGVGGAAAGINNMTPNNNQANMMAMMQQMQNMNMNPQQQQQQPAAFGMPSMVPSSSAAAQDNNAGGKHNSRLQMHQNLMMQQMQSQMQQQQRNLQQMQRMMQQNPQMMQQMQQLQAQMQQQQQGGMNPQMMQAMMNKNAMPAAGGPGAMPQMMGGTMNPNMMMMGMNSTPNVMMGMNPNMMMAQQPQAPQMNASMNFGGMPMMGAAPNGRASATANRSPEKEDPFAQFGANAFR